MAENQRTSITLPLFVILLIFLLAFIFPAVQSKYTSPSSFLFFYIMLLLILSPGVIFFIYLQKKGFTTKASKAKQIRYYNEYGEVDLSDSNLHKSFCPQCNFKNEKKDIFCGNCGFKF